MSDHLGRRLDRPEHRHDPGQQLAEHLRAADTQPAHRDVVRGDPALRDHPRGPGGQGGAHHLDQGRRDPARDLQARVGVRAARERPAREQEHVRVAQRRDDTIGDLGDVRVAVAGSASAVTSSSTSARPPRACATATWLLVSPTCEPTTTSPCPPGWPSGQMSAARQRLLCLEPGQGAHERRPAAVEERPALGLGLEQAEHDDLQVGVVGGVDDHERAFATSPRISATRAGPPSADVVEPDAVDASAVTDLLRSSRPRTRADSRRRSRRSRRGRTRSPRPAPRGRPPGRSGRHRR